MDKSTLIPFVRPNLDILFVGLNPAQGSSDNRHYFSVNQALWNQLYKAGLIIEPVDKSTADQLIFASTTHNYRGWNYGITDLLPEIAESDSRKIRPTFDHVIKLIETIQQNQPRVVILLHQMVVRHLLAYLGLPIPQANAGQLGTIIPNSASEMFAIGFPHGNAIPDQAKIQQYQAVKAYLEQTHAE